MGDARGLYISRWLLSLSLSLSLRSSRPVQRRAAARAFRNVVAFEVTRRDISRTRASGGALAETRRCFVRFAAARQIDLEMKRLSSI